MSHYQHGSVMKENNQCEITHEINKETVSKQCSVTFKLNLIKTKWNSYSFCFRYIIQYKLNNYTID